MTKSDAMHPQGSLLFESFRADWPRRPYPLVVDHLDAPEGRVCPAASLYAHGKLYGDRLKTASLQPGAVVAAFPQTWIQWVGMLQGCLRRGAVFAPLRAGREFDRSWVEAVDASVVLEPDDMALRSGGGRRRPYGLIVGPPALELSEIELLEATEPLTVDPTLRPQSPVWLDSRLAPLAEALAVVTLLRAQTELRLGLDVQDVMTIGEDDHRLFGGDGTSSSLAAVRSWARLAEIDSKGDALPAQGA